MSTEDGAPSSAAPVAPGLRGVLQPQSGPMVRPSQGQGTVDGAGYAGGGGGHHSVPPPPGFGQAVPTATQVAMQSGHNCKLTKAEAEQAVKMRARQLCLARGIDVPGDEIDFLNRAQVHWIAGDGPMITWED